MWTRGYNRGFYSNIYKLGFNVLLILCCALLKNDNNKNITANYKLTFYSNFIVIMRYHWSVKSGIIYFVAKTYELKRQQRAPKRLNANKNANDIKNTVCFALLLQALEMCLNSQSSA